MHSSGRPISGERLVRPDGRISLGFYGDVYVAGLTLPEIKEKIIKHLQKYINDSALGLIERDNRTGEPKIDEKTKQPVMIDPGKIPALSSWMWRQYNSKYCLC